MNTRIELQIEVTGSASIPGPLHIAATAFLPDPASLGTRPIVIYAFPGGGYSRGYFDMHFAGHTGYSQAEHHVAEGVVFVALDHLGVGDSSVAALTTMRIEDIAAANDAAVREILRRLRAGSLAEEYPALANSVHIGIGQSMGGGLSILMQGRYRTYDAIAALGYSAIHTVLPQRTQQATTQSIARRTQRRDDDPSKFSFDQSSADTDFVYPFHWEDEPADILAADMQGGYPIRKTAPPFGSRTLPNCVIAMMAPGFVAAEAGRIDVPVLMGMGERDTCPDPLREPSAFPKSRDVSVYVVPRMAHMHNFAPTRAMLWDRLVGWSRLVAASSGK